MHSQTEKDFQITGFCSPVEDLSMFKYSLICRKHTDYYPHLRKKILLSNMDSAVTGHTDTFLSPQWTQRTDYFLPLCKILLLICEILTHSNTALHSSHIHTHTPRLVVYSKHLITLVCLWTLSLFEYIMPSTEKEYISEKNQRLLTSCASKALFLFIVPWQFFYSMSLLTYIQHGIPFSSYFQTDESSPGETKVCPNHY